MKKMKIISLFLMIIGVVLLVLGVINSFSNSNKDNGKKEEKIPKTPEEIASTWIGSYKSESDNLYYVIFENYQTAKILLIKEENDYLLPVPNVSYKEMKIDSEKYTGTLKRNGNEFGLLFSDNNENTNDDKEAEIYKKMENDDWTGIYRKNDISIFITKINDIFVYISLIDKKSNTEVLGNIYYIADKNETEETNFISDEKLIYKTANEDLFTITKDGENIKVEYSGINSSFNVFNGKFERYIF